MSRVSKILLVEDHPTFRLGLREYIRQELDLNVCAEAEDRPQALAAFERCKPDLAIVDISLRQSSGIDLVKDLQLRDRSLPILVLSMHDESLYAERALLAGARGYIMKHETAESIVGAIRQVLAGRIFVSDRIMGNILNKFVDNRPEASPLERLTDRELDVFCDIGRGLSTAEIAERLNLSVKTIGTYRERIKEKLNLKNAAELVRHAVYWVEMQEMG